MADVALPTFVAGDVAVAADVDAVFYEDVLASVGGSMSMANGLLTDANMAASLEITAEMTQRGCMVDLSGSSGTANLDYSPYFFGGYAYPGAVAWTYDAKDPYKAIPGGCHTFYTRWQSLALINWSVFWQWDADTTFNGKLTMLARLDGNYVQHRRSGALIVGAGGSPYGYSNGRVWSGHYLADIEQGWHNFELAILVPPLQQGRVHSVSVDVLPMKYGTSA
jgi:hypothetical protein